MKQQAIQDPTQLQIRALLDKTPNGGTLVLRRKAARRFAQRLAATLRRTVTVSAPAGEL